MSLKPIALDHVNIYVRNAARSYEWYTDILGLHTQDIFYHPGTERMRAAFLACDRDHAHDMWDPLESTCRHASLSIL